MDFRPTEEQAILKDSVAGWLRRSYGFEAWRKLAAERPPFSPANWASFADMGWLGLTIPEDMGGIGQGQLERMLLAEAFGAHLVMEPYLSTAVLGAELIARAGSPAQQEALLPRIAAGDLRLAFAHAETGSRFALDAPQVRAAAAGGGHMITGRKIVVWDAGTADLLVVLAQDGGQDGAQVAAFLVDPAGPGVAMQTYATVDDRQAADIAFTNAPAERLGAGGLAAIEAAADSGVLWLCAEGIGAMAALIDQTLDYVKVRKQFGQPIGDFQVIQHRVVDLRVALEGARAITLYASALPPEDGDERRRAVSAAKVQVGRAARLIGRDAVQLHGGMGMTDQLAIGHYFKRLLVVETLLGDIAHHQARFAALPTELV
ncbi:acyl-CoA dehydrogenase family protein [Ruixingdingia sedimenti]|uniref:Acyl-CoA dehydrogenase family protein n=1 Tax=Ruixingdingia sedimenti TaxID=3073604 RepID=A0ABU1F2W7_9RHOB|nr:acyl-CoA dehydrogenase family protein [Xinfangfangia sp. LG-4]MDR5651215.1 acyl-CoA dehydrogenase family protein [Xinfangfangia sp. LG-4]